MNCQLIARLPRMHITWQQGLLPQPELCFFYYLFIIDILMHKIWIHLYEGSVITFTKGSSYWTRLGTTVMTEDAFLPVALRTEYKLVDSVQIQITIKWCSYSHVSSVRRVTGSLQNRGLIPEGTEFYIFTMTSRWLQCCSIFLMGGYWGHFHTGKEVGT